MSIGSLAVRVAADTTQFNRSMDRTKRPTRSMQQQMRQVGKRAGIMAGALAAAGAAITTQLTRKGLDAVDSQAKLARSIGGTVEATQGLVRVADRAGVSQGALESAVEKLNQRLGEAMEGSGQAADRLDQLGLSAENLANMDVDERMATLSDTMRDAGMNSAQMGNALRDLGIRQNEVTLLMQEGGDAIRQSTQQVKDFGVAVDDVEAAQVEAANDAFADMGMAIEAVSNQLAVQLAPFIEEISALFIEAGENGFDIGEAVADGVEIAVNATAHMADTVEGIRRSFQLAGVSAAIFALKVKSEIEGIKTAFEVDVPSGVWESIKAMSPLAKAIEGITGAFSDDPAGGMSEGVEQEMTDTERAIEKAREDIDDILQKPFPGDAMREWAADAQERSRETANRTVEDRQKERERSLAIRQLMAREFGAVSDQERAKESENNDLRIAQMREFLGERAQQEVQDHEQKMERLREMLEEELITKEEFKERERALEEDHQGRLNQIAISGANQRADAEEEAQQKRKQAMQSAMGDMTSLMQTNSRKLFEIGKAAALANAIIDGKAAITGAYAVGARQGGPALGAAYATAAGAATYAQIQGIRGQSMNGGSASSGAAAGQSGGNPEARGGSQQAGGPQSGGGDRTISIQGLGPSDMISGEMVAELARNIEEAAGDGRTRIRVD